MYACAKSLLETTDSVILEENAKCNATQIVTLLCLVQCLIISYRSFSITLLVCRTPGPTACLKLIQKVCLKRWRKEKKSMTGLGRFEPAAI